MFKFFKYLEILRWKLWGSEQFAILIVRFDLSSWHRRILKEFFEQKQFWDGGLKMQ